MEPTLDQAFLDANRDIPDTIGDVEFVPGDPETAVVAPVQPSAMLTAETLEITFAMMFNMIADGIGEGGEFWQLREAEKRELAKAWLPVLGPLLDMWGASGHLALITAAGMTLMTLTPRLVRDKARRKRKAQERQQRLESSPPESTTASMATERSGDSYSSQDLLAAARAAKPIV